MTRSKAFIIHLGISFVIFLVLLYFILSQWYPQPLFSTDGGWRVIRIIVFVDLILGPALTAIIFKPGKPGLKFDMFIIATIQAGALAWGTYTTYIERPAAVVYTIDHFTPVPAYQLAEYGITAKHLKEYGDSWPVMIYSEIPVDLDGQSKVLSKALQTKTPLYLISEYYRPFSAKYLPVIVKNKMQVKEFVKGKPELEKIYQQALLSLNPAGNDYIFVALHSRENWATGVLDLNTMKLIETIDISPEKYLHTYRAKKTKEK